MTSVQLPLKPVLNFSYLALQGWASYDERVDLYSLGIVALELWHPFATGMERVETLRGLREGGQLPEGFQEEHPAVRTTY